MDRRLPHWDERGFTLVELMMVVLIIGILIGIAIPSFVGARHTSADRAAQSELRTGLAAGLTFFAQEGAWDGFDAVEAEAAEPNLVWIDGGSPAGDEVSIQVNSGSDLVLVNLSASGTYFCVAQVLDSPATDRGSGATLADVDSVADCTGGW
jgi:type IV pilus assembly protein PilA